MNGQAESETGSVHAVVSGNRQDVYVPAAAKTSRSCPRKRSRRQTSLRIRTGPLRSPGRCPRSVTVASMKTLFVGSAIVRVDARIHDRRKIRTHSAFAFQMITLYMPRCRRWQIASERDLSGGKGLSCTHRDPCRSFLSISLVAVQLCNHWTGDRGTLRRTRHRRSRPGSLTGPGNRPRTYVLSLLAVRMYGKSAVFRRTRRRTHMCGLYSRSFHFRKRIDFVRFPASDRYDRNDRGPRARFADKDYNTVGDGIVGLRHRRRGRECRSRFRR